MRSPLAFSALLAAGSILSGVGCAAQAPSRPAVYNHPVFFTLEDPSQADALIRDCDERIASIPGVVSYYCGKPHDIGRASVDLDFDVGLYVGFDSEADYRAYVEHPSHKALVEKWGPRAERIRVHDVVDATP